MSTHTGGSPSPGTWGLRVHRNPEGTWARADAANDKLAGDPPKDDYTIATYDGFTSQTGAEAFGRTLLADHPNEVLLVEPPHQLP